MEIRPRLVILVKKNEGVTSSYPLTSGGLTSGGLFENIPQQSFFYFVHSFAMELNDATIARTEYGIPFTSALRWRNFYGVQFHPEKSAGVGEQLLRNFLTMKP